MPRKPKAELSELGGIVTVAPPADFGIRSVWADPASVTPNDANWKVHPDDQREAVGDLIDRHGWLKPFLFNTKSGKLVDGHARLQVAVAKGIKAVPVWVGEWDDGAEAEILALLDETARMAEAEPDKLKALTDRMKGATTRALADVLGRLKSETGLSDLIARAVSASRVPVVSPTAEASIAAAANAHYAAHPGADPAAPGGYQPLAVPPAPPAEVAPPEDFRAYDEAIETQYACPKCAYKWSGKPS